MRIGPQTSLPRVEPEQTAESSRARNRNQQAQDTPIGAQQDSVSLSDSSVRTMAADTAGTAGASTARLQSLQAAVRSGQYAIQPDKIADSMMRELM